MVVNGRPADEVPAWRWLRDRPSDEIAYEMPGLPNELVERYFMYGQLVHGHRITNGGLFAGQIGHDFTAAGRRAAVAQQRAVDERARHQLGDRRALGLSHRRLGAARSHPPPGRLRARAHLP